MSGHNHEHNHEHEEECCCHSHEHEHHHDNLKCSCCSHDDDHGEQEITLKKIIGSAILLALGIAMEHLPFFSGESGAAADFIKGLGLSDSQSVMHNLTLAVYLAAFLLCGRHVILKAVRNILKGEIFDEQFLMTVASLGAIFLGECGEAVAVMLFYNIGEYFQDYAVDKSRDSISALMDIRPDRAFVIRDRKSIEVKPEEVAIDEIIEVKPGERVPLDGTVTEGSSFADTSALTGESVPRKIEAGTEVLSGFVNQSGVIRIRVTKSYGDSAVTRILELTQEATEVKAKSEKFITKFARVYTPIVCILAVAVAVLPPVFFKYLMPQLSADNGFETWIYRGLMFLVVSCPCALVISVPLSFFSGIGGASSKGILIKGSNYVEMLAKVNTAVFDKTGTLTKGVFAVSKVMPAEGFSEDEVLTFAAHAEYYSNHPISRSLKTEHISRNNGSCNCCENSTKENAEEISGHGVKISVDGRTILAGNLKLMAKENVAVTAAQDDKTSGTVVHVAVDGKYAGCVVISDELKEDSVNAIRNLKKCGIKQTVMLTGDNNSTAQVIAEELGMDKVYAELLPQDKVSKIEELLEEKDSKVMFVGDGVNDSPVLARADVGVAMGALGSDAAIEAADVVIMDDKPSRLEDAIKISRKTMSIVYQNIIFSLGVKVGIMVLGTAGITNMWAAVFADVGVTFLAVLNSMRALNSGNK